MAMTDRDRREWHLDRKVTLALIVALLANAAATVWWASKLEQRVSQIEVIQSQRATTPERLTRVETQVQNVADYLKRIDEKLDRLIERK